MNIRRSLAIRCFLALAALGTAVGAIAQASGEPATSLVAAAREQIGVTLHYDGRYTRLPYPGGDVAADRGVCTDVVVRAYRRLGLDLQQRVHEDMRANFRAYPALWGLRAPDRNIDHRRVPNLAMWFARQHATQPVTRDPADYLSGDIVTWQLPSGLPHIGIVADDTPDATPHIIHNIGAGTQIEDVLFAWTITGHYRYTPGAVSR